MRRALNEWSLDVYGRNIDDPSIALDVEDMLAASDDLVGRRLSRNRGTMYQADIDASPLMSFLIGICLCMNRANTYKTYCVKTKRNLRKTFILV